MTDSHLKTVNLYLQCKRLAANVGLHITRAYGAFRVVNVLNVEDGNPGVLLRTTDLRELRDFLQARQPAVARERRRV